MLEERMKIGIVSLYRTLKLHQNYGTLLQNFALQTHLQKQGHETFWIRTIRYKSKEDSKNETGKIFGLYYFFKNFLSALRIDKYHAAKRNNPYWDFFIKNVPHTRTEYDYEGLLKKPPKADAYISGSDQVWSHANPMFFLDFAPPSSIRISYAASAKWQTISEQWLKRAASCIQNLDAVSVREVDGLTVCRSVGRNDAQLVLDPVFLLTADEYRAHVKDQNNKEEHSQPFLWSYFVDAIDQQSASYPVINQFSKCNDLEIKTDLVRSHRIGSAQSAPHFSRRTPTEWMSAFDKAEYVFTNSFHGTVFSIIFEKPFLVALREGEQANGNARILSLLNLLGLKNRAMKEADLQKLSLDGLERTLLSPIDWCLVKERLDLWRNRSINFLDEALEGRNWNESP